MLPRIACLDLDTFFVSVERLLDPRLVGQPVVVGASGWRGVVTSASYEVRALGVRSGMSIAEARRLAPGAVYLDTRHDTYGGYARQVKEIIERRVPEVQTASIDEFYLDWSGTERLYGGQGDASILRAAWALRDEIQRTLGLPASIGIGSGRAVAKIASGRAKPAGVVMVPGGQEMEFLRPLPVRRFPGIGPKAEAALVAAGLPTLGHLLDLTEDGPFSRLRGAVAAAAEPQARTRLGADRPAFKEHDEPGTVGSISNERTFFEVIGDPARVHAELRALAERVCWRARKRGLLAGTVTLKLRTSDFETVSRSRSLPPTTSEVRVLETLDALLPRAWRRRLPVRLLGVQLSNLREEPAQVALPFGKPAPSAAIDAVRERFGFDAIRLGATARRRGAA